MPIAYRLVVNFRLVFTPLDLFKDRRSKIVTVHAANIFSSNTANRIKFMKPERNFNQDKPDQAKSDADRELIDNPAPSAQATQEELDRDEDLLLKLRSSDGAGLARAA
jgi:hypothetical protein